VAGAAQPLPHVAAHLAEADQSEVHARCPFVRRLVVSAGSGP
jgi:hypothetical protein